MEVACIKHCSRIYPKELKKTTNYSELLVEPGISKVRNGSAVKIKLRDSVNDVEVRSGEETVMVFLKVELGTGFENFSGRIFINPSLKQTNSLIDTPTCSVAKSFSKTWFILIF